MPGEKVRADKILVEKGLAESRQKAQSLIMAGLVFSGNIRISKPGEMLSSTQPIRVKEPFPYVSRGGLKLEEAVNFFKVKTKGITAADLGASTGGFTDCLLKKGASKVYAVDVDIRQLDWILQNDPRVVQIRKNVRYLEKADFSEPLDLVTCDLSFISVLKIFPAVAQLLGKGLFLTLIKPQFEVGRKQVGKKGIVRDPNLHREVLEQIFIKATEMGWRLLGVMRPTVKGQKGNQEYFMLWRLGGRRPQEQTVKKWIEEAVSDEKN